MGLKRVLLCVAPLISIIALMGFNLITEDFFSTKNKTKPLVKGILFLAVILFPFTNNKAAINWKKDLCQTEDQLSAIQVSGFLNKIPLSGHRFFFDSPYLCEGLKIDPFDENVKMELTKDVMSQTASGDIVIWDNWYAPTEHSVTKMFLDSNSELINLFNTNHQDNGGDIIYSVYKRK